jgi:CheY-like chemotaxis protein
MDVRIIVELIELIPSILWFLLVLAGVIICYRPIRDELLPNLRGFKAHGIEFSFVREFIDSAIELAEKSPQWKVKVPSSDKEKVLKRVKRNLRIFRDAEILWVDDHPENNLNERRMFRKLKSQIDIADSTEEALKMLGIARYNLVISDMARGDDDTAGLKFLKKFREFDETTPVIFYVGMIKREKGVPPMASGITNRPDELLHLTLDALERKRY